MHERLVQVPAEVDCVWGTDILDYRVEHIECG